MDEEEGSFEPPQSITNASRPRTLMPKEEVLENTDAITGNSSFLMVEKSRMGRMMGREWREASTMPWVGDSIARWMMGRISKV